MTTPTIKWLDARTRPFGQCLFWTGAHSAAGYGLASWTQNGKTQNRVAHRLSYELHVAPIPEGYELHHICGHRCCVKPTHLVPLSPSEHNWVHESHKNSAAGVETLRQLGFFGGEGPLAKGRKS